MIASSHKKRHTTPPYNGLTCRTLLSTEHGFFMAIAARSAMSGARVPASGIPMLDGFVAPRFT